MDSNKPDERETVPSNAPGGAAGGTAGETGSAAGTNASPNEAAGGVEADERTQPARADERAENPFGSGLHPRPGTPKRP